MMAPPFQGYRSLEANLETIAKMCSLVKVSTPTKAEHFCYVSIITKSANAKTLKSENKNLPVIHYLSSKLGGGRVWTTNHRRAERAEKTIQHFDSK